MSELFAGAGCGAVKLPKEFFINYDDEGNISYEDGFTGDVYSFEFNGRSIADYPMVRVLLIEDEQRAAIISMEIAQTPADLINAVKDCINDLCGVDNDHIWVHTTHSFGFMHRPGAPDKFDMFNKAVMDAVRDAVKEASDSFQRVYMGIGTCQCHASANKNITEPGHPGEGPYYGPGSDLETDTLMTVLTFRNPDGALLCSFVSYDMKPSCLCTTGKTVGNRLLNSEVPGVACKVAEDMTGAPCIFCMSAAGDQYPVKTAMYYGYDEDGNWKVIDIGFEKGIRLVYEQGLVMGADIAKTVSSVKNYVDSAPVDATASYFSYANKAGDGSVDVPVEYMAIGEVALCGVKQEVDCITGIQLREASPYAHTLMVSFLNGDGKYMPHREAFDFNEGVGTWETARSAFAPGAAEELVSISIPVLNAMHEGSTPKPRRLLNDTRQAGVSSLSTMTFGDIQWYILDIKHGNRLLLMKSIQEIRPYCNTCRPVTWEDSDIRAYLNGEFIEEHFSAQEQARMITTHNENRSNSKYGISGGNVTDDRVFLLSIDECELYLGGFKDLITASTETGEKMWWHLRTPGEAVEVNACVDAKGMIDYHGMSDSLEIPKGGVRPALWIC